MEWYEDGFGSLVQGEDEGVRVRGRRQGQVCQPAVGFALEKFHLSPNLQGTRGGELSLVAGYLDGLSVRRGDRKRDGFGDGVADAALPGNPLKEFQQGFLLRVASIHFYLQAPHL